MNFGSPTRVPTVVGQMVYSSKRRHNALIGTFLLFQRGCKKKTMNNKLHILCHWCQVLKSIKDNPLLIFLQHFSLFFYSVVFYHKIFFATKNSQIIITKIFVFSLHVIVKVAFRYSNQYPQRLFKRLQSKQK